MPGGGRESRFKRVVPRGWAGWFFSNASVRPGAGGPYVLGACCRTTERKKLVEPGGSLRGDASPDGMQRLLNFSPWGRGRVPGRRGALRWCGCPGGPRARCWRWTRPGFLKKGKMSAPLWPGNIYRDGRGGWRTAQVGMFLAVLARRDGARGPDRPRALRPEGRWGGGPGTGCGGGRDRRRRGRFATKTRLAEAMIGRAFESGPVPF